MFPNFFQNYNPESYHRRNKTFDKKESPLRISNELNPRTTPLLNKSGIKPKGLRNIGATCYMNATLQCFFHIKKLTKYLIENGYVKNNIEIPFDSLTGEYIKLVKEISYKDGQTDYAPYDFKDILGRKNPLFKGIAANDSKDLILFMEEELARDLTIKNKKSIFGKKSDFFDQANEMDTFRETVKEFEKDTSIIKDIFFFMIKTVSICKNCNSRLYNFQVMNFLIFPLQKTYNDSKNMTSTMMIKNMINNMNNNMNNMNNLYNMHNNMNNMNNLYNMNNSMNNMNNFYNMNNSANNIYGLVNNNRNMNMNMINNMNNNQFNNNYGINSNNNRAYRMNSLPSYRSHLNNMMNMNPNQMNNNYRSNSFNHMNNNINNMMNNMNAFSMNNVHNYKSNSDNAMNINFNDMINTKKTIDYDNNKNEFNINKNLDVNSQRKKEEVDLNSFRRKAKPKNQNFFSNSAENNIFRNNNNYHNNIFSNNNYNNNISSYQQNINYHNRRINDSPYPLLKGAGGTGPYDSYFYGNKTNKGPKITLDQCFESYLLPELMTGENKQYCNKCGILSDAVYSTTLYSSPNILILILNYGKGILFECDVYFDEYIDISKYVEKKDNAPTRYRLLGAIVHIGPSSMGGHFIAYCRSIEDSNKWYKLNDSIVTEASFSEIKQVGIPYVLFYENVNKY